MPIGTYLFDAAARLGVSLEADCLRKGSCDSCVVTISNGAGLLSEPTKAELEHLNAQRRKKGERLSCQAKLEKPGEICAVTTEKPKPVVSEFESFKKEFAELPLTDKIKNLLELESITLGETFNFILNLPYAAGEKLRDSLAEFGFKMEEDEKRAKKPSEHHETTPSEPVAEEKTKTRKAPARAATAKKTPTVRKRTPKTPKTEGNAE